MKQNPTDELPRLDSAFAFRLLDGIRQTSDYEAAVLWLKTYLVYPARRKAKTSSYVFRGVLSTANADLAATYHQNL